MTTKTETVLIMASSSGISFDIAKEFLEKSSSFTSGNGDIGIDSWGSHPLTDLFTRLKVDGKLKIMNKVLQLHP